MLKKIPVEQVRVGMHIHEMCGAWLDHPFWRSRFVLREPDDLRKLQASRVREVIIDVTKGLDISPPETVEAAPAAAATAVPPSLPATPRGAPASATVPAEPPPPSADLQAELQRATQVLNQSRSAVNSLFAEARMGRALDAEQCLPLVDAVASSVFRNPGAFVSLARLKTHDDYTYMHSVAVCALMIALARQLGMDEAAARDAGLAGMLHDLGKSAMPLDVLNKPGKLTDDEYGLMKTHPERGFELLQESRGVNEAALDVCLHHHERPDGAGYPHKLSGDALSRYARMGAVCDVYDAITSNRPYKMGWDPAESIAKMASWGPGQFDPQVFQAFVRSLGIYPTGSLVRLKSGRLAVVVEQNERALVNPKVKVFFSTRSNMPTAVQVIDLADPGCNDAIVARESNAQWKFPHLDELWAGADNLRRKG